MSRTTLGFIFAGLAYLVVGVTLGALFIVFPELRPLSTAHAHLNLVGFVTFLIFGVAYHILPRFRGRPLHSEPLAWWQFWLANIGLIGLLVFMGIGAFSSLDGLNVLLGIFGALLALSVYLFVYNLTRTLV